MERLGLGRLLGLRRGGPEPPATRAGQPLHPLTLPNLVGFGRLALIAVFLALAFPSGDGRVALATTCWAIAAAADYLDGMLARLTGQYSRLGALMDPFVDRTLILAGVVVDWKFELLPRWALAALAVRELAMIVLVLGALRLRLDIEINWVGRLAVWPTMMGVGGALLTDSWVPEALLYLGLGGAVAASAMYVGNGLRKLRAGGTGPAGRT